MGISGSASGRGGRSGSDLVRCSSFSSSGSVVVTVGCSSSITFGKTWLPPSPPRLKDSSKLTPPVGFIRMSRPFEAAGNSLQVFAASQSRGSGRDGETGGSDFVRRLGIDFLRAALLVLGTRKSQVGRFTMMGGLVVAVASAMGVGSMLDENESVLVVLRLSG
jgi:hypothetical protein